MKTKMILLLSILGLVLIACSNSYDSTTFWNSPSDLDSPVPIPPRGVVVSLDYLTFEQALESATDVVIAQYLRSRPFGKYLLEFEFLVSDRILGEASERIFVYVDTSVGNHIIGASYKVSYHPENIALFPGTNYLLPLVSINHPLANTHEDGFMFIRNIVIDLDKPERSFMYSEPLASHTDYLDHDASPDDIVEIVQELTQDNEVILSPRLESLEDILLFSPYVFVVEINEPFSLSSEQRTTDWRKTDLYNVIVSQIVKGEREIGFEGVIEFAAGTVFTGEQHIVAVEAISEGSLWFRMTSRNSLFQISQLKEITEILSQLGY